MVRNSRHNLNFKQIDRLQILSGVFFLLIASLIWRLFDLQILKGAVKQAEAYDQRAVSRELLPRRGEIYTISSIHNKDELQPLAINEKRYLLYVNPNEITNPNQISESLVQILNLSEQEQAVLKLKLEKQDDPFESIKHGVLPDKAQEILDLNLTGIYTQEEIVRYYPMKNIFSHLTGFLGFKGDKRIGQYGIEGFYEKILAGTQGFLESELDPVGRLIALAERSFKPAIDGADIVLTIDPNIQQKSCSLIKAGLEKYLASSGTIIVMEPSSGAIRAMCNVPNFDPNNYSDVADINVFINSAVSDVYEPGSIFKAITMAAALDSGSLTADTKYIDTGKVIFGEHVIKNVDNKIYGEQTMSQVLEKSINTGSVFAAMQTGREIVRDYTKSFGFGKNTGISLPAEVNGDISSLDKTGDIFLATASFGQGISVTPLQMIQAYGAIANQGKLVAPRIIEKIKFADGAEHNFTANVLREVISTQTSAILSAILINVIEKGHGKIAQVPGFYLAGKTGTAQIAGVSGYLDETIHSFIGFGPIFSPRFVVLIKLDKPQYGRFAANTVAPIFSELANFLLQYYQVAPER